AGRVATARLGERAAPPPPTAALRERGLGGFSPASTFVATPKSLQKSLATALGSSTTGSGGTPTGAVLKLGDTGQDVVDWQNALNHWIQASGSSLTPLTADGTFGPGTQQTTVALQTAALLSPDGIIGPTPRTELEEQGEAD